MWDAGYPGIAGIPNMLGRPFRVDMATGWRDPLLADPDGFDIRSLRLEENHPAHTYHFAVLTWAMQETRGKSFPSMGAFYHGGDTLAALRGTEQLLIDCTECPDAVREAEDWLMDMWFDFYDGTYAAAGGAQRGSACWMGLWATGKAYAVSNDFSYNISTSMFSDLFFPIIEQQTRFLDHSIYHVDGVGAFKHVDVLCALPRLQALQILPGAGQPSSLHFVEVLNGVQAAGENPHISVAPEQVGQALSMLSARRAVYCDTYREPNSHRGTAPAD